MTDPGMRPYQREILEKVEHVSRGGRLVLRTPRRRIVANAYPSHIIGDRIHFGAHVEAEDEE